MMSAIFFQQNQIYTHRDKANTVNVEFFNLSGEWRRVHSTILSTFVYL